MRGAARSPREAREQGASRGPQCLALEVTGRPPAETSEDGVGIEGAFLPLSAVPGSRGQRSGLPNLAKVGSPGGGAQRAMPAWPWPRGGHGAQACLLPGPSACAGPSGSVRTMTGPRPCRRSQRKGRGGTEHPHAQPYSISVKQVGGPPPCEQQSQGSHPCSPPATLCPIPHATLGPGPRELTWRKLLGPPGTDARGPDARWPSRAQRQLQTGPHAAQGLTPRGSFASICPRKDVPPAIRDVGDEARRPR